MQMAMQMAMQMVNRMPRRVISTTGSDLGRVGQAAAIAK
jgi:hypothetical protein